MIYKLIVGVIEKYGPFCHTYFGYLYLLPIGLDDQKEIYVE